MKRKELLIDKKKISNIMLSKISLKERTSVV